MNPLKLRKKLHSQPETAFEEWNTTKILKKEIQNLKTFNIKEFEKTGFIAETINEGKPSILFRTDIDALPIEDDISEDYVSRVPGTGHKCGHDGHASTMIAFAQKLSKSKPIGNISLLFQPAEETGEGAKYVLDHDFMQKKALDYVYAYHNLPGYPKGHIVLKDNEFTKSVISFQLYIKGESSHAAEPDIAVSPTPHISEWIKSINNWNESAEDGFIGTIVYIELGKMSFGVAPGEATIAATIRTHNNSGLELFKNRVEEKLHTLDKKYKTQTTIEWKEEFKACNNDPEAVEVIRQAAENLNYPIINKKEQFPWGEDFGLFTMKNKGAMFGIGIGEKAPVLHSPQYDFDDDIIEIGSNLFHEISRILCTKK